MSFKIQFEDLKQLLLQLPIVRLFDPQLGFIIETDKIVVALNGVLKQTIEDTGL